MLKEFHDLKEYVQGASGVTGELKVLMIGNSFSQDVSTHLLDLASSANVNITIATLSIGSATLQMHYENSQNNANAYTYLKWSPYNGYTSRSNTSLEYGLQNEVWDIVTFQQQSGNAGVYETYQPYLNNLIPYVKEKAKNSNVKLGLHMTWAYASDATHADFPKYNNNQMTMFNAVNKAYMDALEESDFDILIPTGTAIQNARTHSDLNSVGRQLTRDGTHLDLGIGRYIGALTVFEALVGKNSNSVTFVPNGATKYQTFLAKKAVTNAVNNPFNVTDIG